MNFGSPSSFPHYYGDIVRKLFLAAGLLMLVALPFFSQYLPVSAVISLAAVLAISLIAGFTNPMQKYTIVLDVITSLIALFTFEYHAITHFSTIPTLLFWIDQVLGLLFFFALYYSTKTWRGITVSDYTIYPGQPAQHEKESQDRYPGQ